MGGSAHSRCCQLDSLADADISHVSGGDEQVIQLSNGCLCCGIRDDLRATLADLAERRQAGEIAFDQVMIETTGLADPGPIAQTFFLDPGISARYRPDAILTLVDAKHAMDQFDARGEARRQVGFADRLFISKTDLVDDDTLSALRDRLRRMNPRGAESGGVRRCRARPSVRRARIQPLARP
jgi:G3E family GTPase